MPGYYGPNEVRNLGKSLDFNRASIISPAQVAPPTPLAQFASGNIPLYVPRQPVTLFPTSHGGIQPVPPEPPKRGR